MQQGFPYIAIGEPWESLHLPRFAAQPSALQSAPSRWAHRGWVRLLPTLWNLPGSPSSDPACGRPTFPPRGRHWQTLEASLRKIPQQSSQRTEGA